MHCDGWTGDYSAICSFTSLAKGKNKGENHISWGENDTSISTESLFSLLSFLKYEYQNRDYPKAQVLCAKGQTKSNIFFKVTFPPKNERKPTKMTKEAIFE